MTLTFSFLLEDANGMSDFLVAGSEDEEVVVVVDVLSDAEEGGAAAAGVADVCFAFFFCLFNLFFLCLA